MSVNILSKNSYFVKCSLSLLFVMVLVAWLSCILLTCGDIAENPGPSSSSVSSSISNISNVSSLPYENHLSICHLNIQSIVPKLDILQFEMQQFDVYIFTETWLTNTIDSDDVKVINFQKPFRCDRDSRSGGVAIYVKDQIVCVRRTDLEVKDLECVWLQVKTRGRNILICGLYRPPNASVSYWNLIHESFDRAKNTSIKDIFLLGDLNNDILNTVRSKHLTDFMITYNLQQLIEEPTHYTESSSSLIDIIIANSTQNVLASEVCDPFIPDLIRYHLPVAVLLKFLKPKQSSFKRKIWKYAEGNYDLYRQLLAQSDWEQILTGQPEYVTEQITTTILKAATDSIPNKYATIRPADPPWMHNEIRKLIRQRKRLHKRAKRIDTVQIWRKFRKLRNKIVKEIRSSKVNYENRISNLLKTNTQDTRTWWKLSKQVLKLDKKEDTIPSLYYNNNTYEDDADKAEIFNDYFISQSQLNDSGVTLPDLILPPYQLLESITISPQDVLDILKSLDITKASGPDQINPQLLKEASHELCIPLSIFFSRLITLGKFPQAWKNGNLTPIHKKDARNLPKNYRPISLLSVLGKTMERAVHKQVYNYCISNNVFTSHQSGFIKGDSTTYQLLHLYNSFCEAVDSGKEVRVIFFDISKAFDRVWHRGLLHKLQGIGLSGEILDWFSDYLSSRK
ncbi:MAG: reverse transcriptase family protein, partial [Candidatus Thiodiazotropha sp.]